MSRTYKNSPHLQRALTMGYYNECMAISTWDMIRINRGSTTLVEINEENEAYYHLWIRQLKSGHKNCIKRQGPLKYYTAKGSRQNVRQEINKFYKDYEYEVMCKPYNKCDDLWNWD